MTIHLGCPLLNTSRDLPGRQCEDAPAANRHRPYSVLLPVGFTMPPQLPLERCALTAPFHPYLHKCRRFAFCGTFPRVAPAGRYPAPYPRGARTFLPQHLSVYCARSSNRLACWRVRETSFSGNVNEAQLSFDVFGLHDYFMVALISRKVCKRWIAI